MFNSRDTKNRNNLMTYFQRLALTPETVDFAADWDFVDDPLYKFVIAREASGKGPIVAYCCVRIHENQRAEIVELHTTIKHKGIGSKLIRLAEKTARDMGATCIFLFSVPQAIGFYQLQGYRSSDGHLFQKKL